MQDTELITFENQDIGEIRGFIKNGEPWFLAGQVCRCLGIKDASAAVKQTEERLKIADVKGTISNRILLETTGGKQQVLVVNEQCLYELIFASRKKKAIKFRAWVTGEVLPEIRKTGQYRMAGKLIRRALTDEIQESGENERMHGHGYSTYTKLINKSIGLPAKNNRDKLSPDVLEKAAMRENTIQALMREGKQYNEIKEVIETLSEKAIVS